MNWGFTIDDIAIDQPIGFNDLIIRARRDENWHGVMFEASTSDLTFYGEAALYLKEQKRLFGFAADVTFTATWECDSGNEVLSGKLDFRRYRESCGNECLVTLPVEQEGCTMTLRNRYDQKVDLNNGKSFNGITNLQNYAGLNFDMELPAQAVQEALRGFVQDGGSQDVIDEFDDEASTILIRPTYQNQISNTIATGQLLPINFFGRISVSGNFDQQISPQLLFEDNIRCFSGDFPYEIRMKGNVSFVTDVETVSIYLKVIKWDGTGSNIITAGDEIASFTIWEGEHPDYPNISIPFDQTFSGNVDLPEGWGLYAFLWTNGRNTVTVDWDQETYINVYADKNCPATDATVSLIHETASRITEAITDVCLKVKSDYYGRTNSEPYAAAADGCGALRILSSGLRIRKADNPTHFLSLKELFDGLNCIDNIGMGIEGDWLRIEPVEYFYRDEEILSMPLIPKASFSLDPEKAYSIVKIGYKKWETEGLKGLDEFNSNKEYRTSLVNINNTLDLTSNFIAAGYVIEQTRQQSFAESGGADTKYDNDTFIICVKRSAYGVEVEQGNISNAANFFSPETAYNWRIRPYYNLMRWWKSLAQSYATLSNTTSKLIFSAGTGNLLATGELTGPDDCKMENGPKAENRDLLRSDFETESLPVWKAETVSFTYPLSLRDFKLIKANPHGYINLQCGNGDFVKAFIINLAYKPAKGEADLTLRLKWQ